MYEERDHDDSSNDIRTGTHRPSLRHRDKLRHFHTSTHTNTHTHVPPLKCILRPWNLLGWHSLENYVHTNSSCSRNICAEYYCIIEWCANQICAIIYVSLCIFKDACAWACAWTIYVGCVYNKQASSCSRNWINLVPYFVINALIIQYIQRQYLQTYVCTTYSLTRHVPQQIGHSTRACACLPHHSAFFSVDAWWAPSS